MADISGIIWEKDIPAKVKAMKEAVIPELRESVKKYMTNNGVFLYYGEPIARFGTAYEYRAMIAISAFGANPVDIAVYPRAENDNNGDVLSGKNSYVLHFDEVPPVKDKGFWSKFRESVEFPSPYFSAAFRTSRCKERSPL